MIAARFNIELSRKQDIFYIRTSGLVPDFQGYEDKKIISFHILKRSESFLLIPMRDERSGDEYQSLH
jgi:hypothetical protein